ncbi:MAG: hypothetical protein AAGD22_14905, partial [Verrucomicrobiota bacterium]
GWTNPWSMPKATRMDVPAFFGMPTKASLLSGMMGQTSIDVGEGLGCHKNYYIGYNKLDRAGQG